jgi:hypothetical protein
MAGMRALFVWMLLGFCGVAAVGATLEPDAAGAVWVADARGVLKLAAPSGDLQLALGEARGVRALAVDREAGVVWACGDGELRAFDLQGGALLRIATPRALPARAPGVPAGGETGSALLSAQPVLPASPPLQISSAVQVPPPRAVAGGGGVWLADGRQLAAYDPAGVRLWSLGLASPVVALGLDAARGLLWVATAERVVAYGPQDGYERLELGLGERPRVVAMAADAGHGRVWVAQTDRLQRYEADGTRTLSVDLAGVDRPQVVAAAADADGGVWLAGGAWLEDFDAMGEVRAAVALGGTERVGDLAVDAASGEVWVARQSEVVRVAASGEVLRRLAFEPPLSILDLAFEPAAPAPTSAPPAAAAPRAAAARPAAAAPAAGKLRAGTASGRGARSSPRSSPASGTTTIVGTVLLPSGAPASGVAVSVLGVSGATGTTAADGTFSIGSVAATAGEELGLTATTTASGPALYLNSGVIAVVGGTSNAGDLYLNYLCADDYANGLFPTNSLNGTVDALVPFGSGLVAAGSFTSALVGGVNTSGVNRIASWTGSTWAKLGTGLSGGSSPVVSALAVFGGQLYVGGTFTTAGSVAVSNVARWNGTAWSAVGSGLPGAVEALGVWNGSLYAGGAFTTSGSVHFNHIAQWSGTAWVPVGAGFDSDVLALASFDDGSGDGPQLYAGGKFVSGGLTGSSPRPGSPTPTPPTASC